jgi:hypothetical protein
MSNACEFASLDEANEILGLMMRNWNDIAGTLFNVPLLFENEDGMVHGNDWAHGFMQGMRLGGLSSRVALQGNMVRPSTPEAQILLWDQGVVESGRCEG